MRLARDCRAPDTLDDIVSRADHALYLVKHSGKDCAVVADIRQSPDPPPHPTPRTQSRLGSSDSGINLEWPFETFEGDRAGFAELEGTEFVSASPA